MTIALVCPSCHSELNVISESSISCAECNSIYPLVDGYWKFTDETFDPIQHEENKNHHRTMDGERASGRLFVEKYLIPRFRTLKLDNAKVLSIGCGYGADVQELRVSGYETYGVELWRARASEWSKIQIPPEWCYIADARKLPFKDGEFDIVLCIGLIEHIGTVGDTAQLEPDWESQRQNFLKETLRVAKHGVFLTTPNRTFPADFGHGTTRNKLLRWVGRKTGVWFHSPTEPFYLSYRDVERYSMRPKNVAPWELTNYFGFAVRSSHRWVKLIIPLVTIYFGFLDKTPNKIRKSCLNPFLLAFIKSN